MSASQVRLWTLIAHEIVGWTIAEGIALMLAVGLNVQSLPLAAAIGGGFGLLGTFTAALLYLNRIRLTP